MDIGEIERRHDIEPIEHPTREPEEQPIGVP